MVTLLVIVSLVVAVIVAFFSSLVEATYLTLRPFSLSSVIADGSSRGAKALEIVSEKTRLVSVTTFIDTVSNVVLASAIGLTLAEIFGPIGWIYSAVAGSFVIMTLLYLLPKAIGIENALRMSLFLAPATIALMTILAPIAVPLTRFARWLSERLVGKPGYKEVDLADEFEDVVTMLERAGHIEPDAGRLLRTALTSTKSTAGDSVTPIAQIISVGSSATVLDALRIMGQTGHPRIPVYDQAKDQYIGAVTFHTMSKAMSRELIDSKIHDYMIQPARVSADETLPAVMEKLQDAVTTIAFVFDRDRIIGVFSLSDIIEQILGIKV